MKARLAAFLVVLSMMGAAHEAAATIGNTPPGEALTISNTGSPNFTQGATGCTSTSLSFNSNSFVTCNSGAWAVNPVQVGAASSPPQTCSSTYEGMEYFDTGSNTLKYCNGSIWAVLGSGSLSGSGTTNYDAIWTSATTIGTGAIYQSGSNVGIWTTSPAVALQLGNAITADFSLSTGGTQSQIFSAPTNTAAVTVPTLAITTQPSPASNSSATFYGLLNDMNVPASSSVTYNTLTNTQSSLFYLGTGNASAIAATSSFAESNSAATVTTLEGTFTQAWNISTGPVTNMYGAFSQARNAGGGTVTNAYGTFSRAINAASASSTITNAYGVNASVSQGAANTIGTAYGLYTTVTNSGTMTNGYGLYIDAIAGTTNYGLYQANSSNQNYFAGNVGIGTTSPANTLTVNAPNTATNASVLITKSGSGATQGLVVQETSGFTVVPVFSVQSAAGSNVFSVSGNGSFQSLGGTIASNSLVITSAGSGPTIQMEFPSFEEYDLRDDGTNFFIQDATASATRFLINSSGNVGIGTTSPQSKLQISGGEVQVGSSGLSCASNNAGAISYSSGSLNYCNGTIWTSTGSGGSGLPSGASQYQMIREGTSTPQWENAPYDVASFMPSTPQASSFINIVLPRNIQLPSGLPSSQCIAITAATTSTTVTINKISGGTTTTEGTAVWAAAAKTCTFTFSSAISFAAGDMIQFAFPAPADATLANVSITLAGIRQ